MTTYTNFSILDMLSLLSTVNMGICVTRHNIRYLLIVDKVEQTIYTIVYKYVQIHQTTHNIYIDTQTHTIYTDTHTHPIHTQPQHLPDASMMCVSSGRNLR